MNTLLLCVLCVLSGESLPDEGYLGADVKDNASGQTVFSWFSPGPLDGAGLHSNAFDLHRPDVLVAVDGTAMNADEFNAYMASLAPGTSVTIQYFKAAQRDTANIPDSVATEGEPQTIAVVLESKEAYTGTIGRPNTIAREIEFTDPPLLDPFDPDNVLGAAVAEHGLRDQIEKLLKVFEDTIEETTDTHMLSNVRAAFGEPFRLQEHIRAIPITVLRATPAPWELARESAAFRLGLNYSKVDLPGGGSGPPELLRRPWGSMLLYGSSDAAEATEYLRNQSDSGLILIDLLKVPRRSFYISGPNAKQNVAAIRGSLEIDFQTLLDASGSLAHLGANSWDWVKDSRSGPGPRCDGATGRIHWKEFQEDIGWIVIGSTDDNRYDMTKIACVVDPGGDDEYWASDLRIGTRAIIDLAGNDTYTGTPDQGPGGAILGVSFIDDRAGNDTYKGEMLSCGAAIYGVSLLLDRGGDDTYSGTDWSMGAGVYGAGMLIDLGEGSDTYTGEFLCQGVGGPRGFGAIIDEGGDDTYMANGPQPSMYGDAGVFASFSQGVGFGYRGYAAGGVGMLSDLGGNDRYESGEFSQGGAYYFALGILHDAKGNDEYIGSRYSQGFGVHQAFGILADDAGDDVYTSKTAASQGAAWDIGAGLLIDRAGNDTYTCDGLGQGGASMQGIAMLVDLAGEDKYNASGGATQGESGGNSYHFARTGAFSFSLLWDEGAGVDFFSRGRENNKVTSTGVVNEADPANSGAHGVVIDR
jgi:hypothetical protein